MFKLLQTLLLKVLGVFVAKKPATINVAGFDQL
ncbi:hypothetical protein SAMN05216490_2348 [Mucilaginibacter mallensis]|uniref:Uncharacterized protein n=1 Tax=Mucilaginibacter mallensis TaxID=652787 RepID=A0A1H1X4Z0_MUCMA|nr:hypothetical protein SAMN05216490_2348 [Mucilaginibacter mallensis]